MTRRRDPGCPVRLSGTGCGAPMSLREMRPSSMHCFRKGDPHGGRCTVHRYPSHWSRRALEVSAAADSAAVAAWSAQIFKYGGFSGARCPPRRSEMLRTSGVSNAPFDSSMHSRRSAFILVHILSLNGARPFPNIPCTEIRPVARCSCTDFHRLTALPVLPGALPQRLSPGHRLSVPRPRARRPVEGREKRADGHVPAPPLSAAVSSRGRPRCFSVRSAL